MHCTPSLFFRGVATHLAHPFVLNFYCPEKTENALSRDWLIVCYNTISYILFNLYGNVGLWSHVVARYDGTKGKAYLFINGKNVKHDTKSGNLPWGTEVVIGGLVDDKGKVTSTYTGGMVGIRFEDKSFRDDKDKEITMDFKYCNPAQASMVFMIIIPCTQSSQGHYSQKNAFIYHACIVNAIIAGLPEAAANFNGTNQMLHPVIYNHNHKSTIPVQILWSVLTVKIYSIFWN